MVWQYLPWVAAGGALGAVGRFVVSVTSVRLLGVGFPYGTLAVNLLGSLLMGVLMGWVSRYFPGEKQTLHALLAVGFLGSFTTFSTFSLDVVLMLERAEYAHAVLYIFISVLLSIAALLLGLWIMRGLPI
jgi:CrcB protein